jgi:(2R)-3-sulfolactate dehydrogenase (NADP+)
LLVEVLATLSGASFSIDAAPFDSGTASPGIGAFLLGIDPANFARSVERLSRRLESLPNDDQVRLPAIEITSLPDAIEINTDTLQRLKRAD